MEAQTNDRLLAQMLLDHVESVESVEREKVLFVEESRRGRGIGAFLVQELERVGYEMGKTQPCGARARTSVRAATHQRAGMAPCGRILAGDIVVG